MLVLLTLERYLRLFVAAFRDWVTSDPPRLRDLRNPQLHTHVTTKHPKYVTDALTHKHSWPDFPHKGWPRPSKKVTKSSWER